MDMEDSFGMMINDTYYRRKDGKVLAQRSNGEYVWHELGTFDQGIQRNGNWFILSSRKNGRRISRNFPKEIQDQIVNINMKKSKRKPTQTFKQFVIVHFDNCAPFVYELVSNKKITIDSAAAHFEETEGFNEDRDSLTFIDEPSKLKI
jgi:hypothetical protein